MALNNLTSTSTTGIQGAWEVYTTTATQTNTGNTSSNWLYTPTTTTIAYPATNGYVVSYIPFWQTSSPMMAKLKQTAKRKIYLENRMTLLKNLFGLHYEDVKEFATHTQKKEFIQTLKLVYRVDPLCDMG